MSGTVGGGVPEEGERRNIGRGPGNRALESSNNTSVEREDDRNRDRIIETGEEKKGGTKETHDRGDVQRIYDGST